MIGRFSARRALTPEPLPAEQAAAALDTSQWTPFPETPAEQAPVQPAESPLHSDKLLDAKVRLHRRLIEEINLSALEKLPEQEMKKQIHGLVAQYVLGERLALNATELEGFVSEILDEMMGLGPIEPLLKDPTISDILINGHENVFVERFGKVAERHSTFRLLGDDKAA